MVDLNDPLERRRLEGIHALGALERAAGPMLDRVVRLAAGLTGAESAAVHIIDADQQHRVAAHNAPVEAWPRQDAMCRLVVEQQAGIATADASTEPRFAYSSFVRGQDPVRFYASAPLQTELYGTIGTVCAWDRTPLPDPQRALDHLRDFAEMVVDRLEADRAIRLLAEVARTDPLTGLANRRMVVDRLVTDLARRDREGAPVALAFIDLDGFKAVNDRHGHDVGDQVLRHVAERLESVVRADELAGRIGGDEFVVVGAGGVRKEAARQRFAEALNEPVSTTVGPVDLSASVGIAMASEDDSADTLLRRADADMFEEKRNGGGLSP